MMKTRAVSKHPNVDFVLQDKAEIPDCAINALMVTVA
jgi:hypothetical protein